MPKLRVHNFSVSLDGFGAGPDQGPDNPLGMDGLRLHDWILATPTFAGASGGSASNSAGNGATGAIGSGLDDEIVAAAELGIGATIMGRNMFGPVRGPWRDPRASPVGTVDGMVG